jgi:hypothetical protein
MTMTPNTHTETDAEKLERELRTVKKALEIRDELCAEYEHQLERIVRVLNREITLHQDWMKTAPNDRIRNSLFDTLTEIKHIDMLVFFATLGEFHNRLGYKR